MVDPKKTYTATVHATHQRVTGRSNDTGTARRPVAITGIKGVLTTAINQQKVIQSMLVVPQSWEQHNQKLWEALYKVFKVKQLPAAPEVKRTPAEPLKIKAIFAPGHRHIYGVNRDRKEDERKPGHHTVPPISQLRKSRECFHCQKKGHYARQCHTKKKEHKQEEATVKI